MTTSQLVMPFRILARFSLWLQPYYHSHTINYDTFNQMTEKTLDEARNLNSKKMPEFMVDRSNAFTTKQARMYRELMKAILAFWKIFRAPFADTSYFITKVADAVAVEGETYRAQELEPIIQFFETESTNDMAYKDFDAYLRMISGDKNALYSSFLPHHPSKVILWNFPEAEAKSM